MFSFQKYFKLTLYDRWVFQQQQWVFMSSMELLPCLWKKRYFAALGIGDLFIHFILYSFIFIFVFLILFIYSFIYLFILFF